MTLGRARPTWLDVAEYPFEPKYFSTDAGIIHYVDEGRGDPIVFVHGVPTWSFLFRKLIRGLSASHRCVAMDHLGFGLSDKPEGFWYDPQQLADHVDALLTKLEIGPATFVVHDWGGPIGLACAGRNPRRISRLVLLNTWLWSADGDRRAAFLARVLASPLFAWVERRTNATSRFFVPAVTGTRRRMSRVEHRHYVEPLAESGGGAAVVALARAIRDAGPWLDRLCDDVQALRDVPTLIVWGMKDKAFTPRDLARWRALFPAAETHSYETVGHFPPEEVGEELCAIIGSFLAATRREERSA